MAGIFYLSLFRCFAPVQPHITAGRAGKNLPGSRPAKLYSCNGHPPQTHSLPAISCITPSGRQLGAAAGVVAVQAGGLDENYMQQWARELKLTEELEKLLSGEIKSKQT
jgi:hypothetical protein